MKIRHLTLLLFGLLILTGFASPGEEFWHEFAEGINKAKETNRLVLVYIHAGWCKWCRKMEKRVFSQPEIANYLDSVFVAVQLDGEDDRTRVKLGKREYTLAEIAGKYQATAYPTILFLEPDGKLLYSLKGYQPADDFMKLLKYVAENKYLDDTRHGNEESRGNNGEVNDHETAFVWSGNSPVISRYYGRLKWLQP